jgi:hypothetical protein
VSKARKKPRTSEPRRTQPVKELSWSHANLVLAAGLLVYLAILATMVAFDSYTFVLKSAVIPFLLAVAVLSHRFQGFVNEWAPFLGAIVLFDSLRSLEFAVTTYFEMPMYAVYAIDWERWLCGGAIAPVSAQLWRSTLSDSYWIDRFFVLVHASHFLFFLLFGFVLWYLRRDVFRTYAAAMIAVLYLALLLQFLVPTIPPWLAARDFALLPPTERLIRSLYNANLPSLFAMFDVNPIAAMPSLHTAMPALCAFVALRYLGRRGLIVVAYAVAAGTGVVYLGEHYAVDVVAGVVLAAVVHAAVRRWGAPATSMIRGNETFAPEALAPRPIIVGVALVAVAFAFGPLTTALLSPLPITVAFVERELVGRSPAANYLLGRLAFDRGDFISARARFALALEDLEGPSEQEVIRGFLRQSEERADAFPRAEEVSAPLRR